MGVGYNPKIVTDGLTMCLDAGNAPKSAKGFKNLLHPWLSEWTIGSGSTSNFYANGTTTENQRILDTGPFGVSTVVWDTPTNDATSNDDGGWNTNSVPIDPTKMYRFSVWMRRKIVGNGASYLGCHGWDVAAQQVLNRSDNVANQNPYFIATNYWGNANEWYLLVGHVWPAGSGTGSAHTDSGIYNTSGTKLYGATDFVWQSTNTYTVHRTYLYYSTDTTTNQQWYQPRIDMCDGTEPTIAELIAGVGSKWYDLAGANHGTILNSAALYNSSGYMNFDGVDDYLTMNDVGSLSTFTCEAFVRITSMPPGYACYISNVYPGTASKVNFALGHVASPSTISCGFFDGSWRYSPTFTPSTNTWYHVVGTYDGSLLKLFINGVSQGTPTSYTGTPTTSNGGIRIGRRWDNPDYFTGHLSSIKLYNRALTDAEIRQNFNAGRGRFGI